jgi:hypothetical protein
VRAPFLVLLLALGCERYESLRSLPAPTLRTHYLLDYERGADREARFATGGHLLVFNPGRRAAELDVTAYFEDREPATFHLQARPGATTESEPREWPVPADGRFALRVESSEPVVAQATIGWNNTAGDFSPAATAAGGAPVREAASSYMGIPALARRWYVADATVIDAPETLWLHESEWALLLNPGDRPAKVRLSLFYRWFARHHEVEVPARRLRAVVMDDLAIANHHYGVRIVGDAPIAAQWRRTVKRQGSPELLAFWSVPGVPLEREGDAEE